MADTSKFVIFGLTVSSSWGNGHATLWRALIRALAARGHRVVFFERDVPYYAAHRDLPTGDRFDLRLYETWDQIAEDAKREVADADVAMVTSYCADAIAAHRLILDAAPGARLFYDLDAPVTLERHRRGERVEYIPEEGLGDYDLVLSYTGGRTLSELQSEFGARNVAPLYGSVDPAAHFPVPDEELYRADLSYLGTYATDRQQGVERFLIEPARRRADKRFLIGGAQYPQDFPWSDNIYFVRHVPPADHPAFFRSSRLTLNVTRAAMAEMGYCPSGRLFEAAACGAAIISDEWEGLSDFFEPGRELLLARTTEDVLSALDRGDEELRRIGAAARDRALSEHTAAHRAETLLSLVEQIPTGETLDDDVEERIA